MTVATRVHRARRNDHRGQPDDRSCDPEQIRNEHAKRCLERVVATADQRLLHHERHRGSGNGDEDDSEEGEASEINDPILAHVSARRRPRMGTGNETRTQTAVEPLPAVAQSGMPRQTAIGSP